AGMADVAGDLLLLEIDGREQLVRDLRKMPLYEDRHRAREHHTEADRVERPTHHVGGIGPNVLGRTADLRQTSLAVGAEDERGGAVGEKRARHGIFLGAPVDAEGERAEFEDNDEDGRALLYGGETGGERKAAHAAGTTEAEHRDAPHICPQSEILN